MPNLEIPSIKKDKKTAKREWLDEIITIEFYNTEEPGVAIKFSYGPTKKSETFTLLHGGKYKLRREIIQHLESREIPVWDYKPDGSGRLTKYRAGSKSRFQCRQVFE